MSRGPEHARPPEERFWPKVDKNGAVPAYRPDLGPCWIWVAAIDGVGYGSFFNGTSTVTAHVFAWQSLRGPIPDGLQLDHLCRVRRCCNPEHLEPVTHAENVRRGTALITHCPKGHEYTPENTAMQKGRGGKRHRKCRTCARDCERRRYALARGNKPPDVEGSPV